MKKRNFIPGALALLATIGVAACGDNETPISISSIEIIGETNYTVGDTFKIEDYTIEATYSDNSKQNITATIDYSEVDMSKPGVYNVYVEFEGKKDVIEITVAAPENIQTLESSVLDTKNAKVEYAVGDELNLEGVSIIKTYTNSTLPEKSTVTESVADFTATIKDKDENVVTSLTTVGSYTVELVKGEEKYSYEITVSKKQYDITTVENAVNVAYDLRGLISAGTVNSREFGLVTYNLGNEYATYVDDYGITYHVSKYVNDQGDEKDFVAAVETAADGSITLGDSGQCPANNYEGVVVRFSYQKYGIAVGTDEFGGVIIEEQAYNGLEDAVKGLYQLGKHETATNFTESITPVYDEANQLVSATVQYSYGINLADEYGFDKPYTVTVSFELDDLYTIKSANINLANESYPSTYEFTQESGERTLEKQYTVENCTFNSFELQSSTWVGMEQVTNTYKSGDTIELEMGTYTTFSIINALPIYVTNQTDPYTVEFEGACGDKGFVGIAFSATTPGNGVLTVNTTNYTFTLNVKVLTPALTELKAGYTLSENTPSVLTGTTLNVQPNTPVYLLPVGNAGADASSTISVDNGTLTKKQIVVEGQMVEVDCLTPTEVGTYVVTYTSTVDPTKTATLTITVAEKEVTGGDVIPEVIPVPAGTYTEENSGWYIVFDGTNTVKDDYGTSYTASYKDGSWYIGDKACTINPDGSVTWGTKTYKPSVTSGGQEVFTEVFPLVGKYVETGVSSNYYIFDGTNTVYDENGVRADFTGIDSVGRWILDNGDLIRINKDGTITVEFGESQALFELETEAFTEVFPLTGKYVDPTAPTYYFIFDGTNVAVDNYGVKCTFVSKTAEGLWVLDNDIQIQVNADGTITVYYSESEYYTFELEATTEGGSTGGDALAETFPLTGKYVDPTAPTYYFIFDGTNVAVDNNGIKCTFVSKTAEGLWVLDNDIQIQVNADGTITVYYSESEYYTFELEATTEGGSTGGDVIPEAIPVPAGKYVADNGWYYVFDGTNNVVDDMGYSNTATYENGAWYVGSDLCTINADGSVTIGSRIYILEATEGGSTGGDALAETFPLTGKYVDPTDPQYYFVFDGTNVAVDNNGIKCTFVSKTTEGLWVLDNDIQIQVNADGTITVYYSETEYYTFELETTTEGGETGGTTGGEVNGGDVTATDLVTYTANQATFKALVAGKTMTPYGGGSAYVAENHQYSLVFNAGATEVVISNAADGTSGTYAITCGTDDTINLTLVSGDDMKAEIVFDPSYADEITLKIDMIINIYCK